MHILNVKTRVWKGGEGRSLLEHVSQTRLFGGGNIKKGLGIFDKVYVNLILSHLAENYVTIES